MSQFLTLSKNDEQFWSTLTGQFSKTHFAQPIRNLYVNSKDETITFKIIEKPSLSLFGALVQWYSLARNIYLVFPIVGGVSFLTAQYGMAPLDLLFTSIFALQFFLMALTLYNDYSDYVNGVDRVNEYSSQKPLIKGLMRPFQARQLAIFFLGCSFVFATYCFVMKPMTLAFAAVALLIGTSLTATGFSHKLKGLSLVGTPLLAGPILVLGYEFLLFGRISLASGLLGLIFGIHALKYEFCKQVRDIFYNSKAQVVTLSTFLGFENSKSVYSLLSLAHVTALVLFAMQVPKPELYLIVVVAICFEAYLNQIFYGAQSFLSSNISDCLSLQKLHYTIENSLLVFIFLSPVWLSLF